ncbi:hypothetical protein [Desulforhopalus sp. IMCC35007]|uniref:hypothetical protein n=1 Tax=Desulforhopalus sp. IMCC35007 TaxID=2569543 RepID=UPI0010ADE8CE|nr:hypothetical protein [Desulforhopalus sp. IMCC35007]TKB06672.1 hypothetical protein FCL48_19730 [Desulforhopalus sp. IMCC35007]
MSAVSKELLEAIREHYPLNWTGTHGVIHWSRVYDIGAKLSEQQGVNARVVQLFSIFHDSQRENEHKDPGHGRRGAQLAEKLRDIIPLNDSEFELLQAACCLHTSTISHGDITVQACFDSDRLDLGRVDIYPDPELLCTPLAKEIETIQWAYGKSLIHQLPDGAFDLGMCEVLSEFYLGELNP